MQRDTRTAENLKQGDAAMARGLDGDALVAYAEAIDEAETRRQTETVETHGEQAGFSNVSVEGILEKSR